MSTQNQYAETHAIRAALKLAADLAQEHDTARAAVLSLDLQKTAEAIRDRPGASPDAVEIAETLISIADGAAVDPARIAAALQIANERDAIRNPTPNRPLPNKIVDLLAADERRELLTLAESVEQRDAEHALAYLELQEASEGSLDLGLSEHEIAAARLLRDERKRGDHLERLGDELAASRRRLDAIARGEI